jgi:hypothetical protein
MLDFSFLEDSLYWMQCSLAICRSFSLPECWLF